MVGHVGVTTGSRTGTGILRGLCAPKRGDRDRAPTGPNIVDLPPLGAHETDNPGQARRRLGPPSRDSADLVPWVRA